MAEEKKTDSFVAQAGILAAAGIVCRIIGILYRSPLAQIIGDEGNGYYSSAYEIYTIILLISSYSIPSAISKVISQRLALKEYQNARRIFHCAFVYVIIVGGIASILTFFFAGALVGDSAGMVLRVFAPTIFFSGLLGVLRGYFQAHGTMVPTSVSQIAEQIMNAAVSLLAAWLLIRSVSTADATTQAVYGASGSALGTGIGVLTALVFMTVVWWINRRTLDRLAASDQDRSPLTNRQIYVIILTMVTPIILSTFIYNCNTSLNQVIYIRIMQKVRDMSEVDAYTNYGLYSGKAKTIMNIPIALASAMSSALIPGISGAFAKKDIRGTRQKLRTAVRTTMLLTIPCAVGLMALAKPVVLLLYPQKDSVETVSWLLVGLCFSIVFFALSTVTNGALQAIGKVNLPVINAAVSLAVQTVLLLFLLLCTNMGLSALVVASFVYSLLLCVLNSRALSRQLGYKQELLKSVVLPLWAAVLMGILAFGVYHLLYLVLPSNVVCLAVAILVGVAVYFVALIRLGGLTRQEMLALPKGRLLIRLAEACHLFKRDRKQWPGGKA